MVFLYTDEIGRTLIFFSFREEAEVEKLALAKKLALTCRSTDDDDKAKQKEDCVDKELEELLDDGFLESYMQQRMMEMIDDSVYFQ